MAKPNRLPAVMIEIRNDLVAGAQEQRAWAERWRPRLPKRPISRCRRRRERKHRWVGGRIPARAGEKAMNDGTIDSNYSEAERRQDVQILHSMGYAQELERRMSGFSNFAVSFSIICILSGAINSLAQATAAQAAPPSASAGRSAASYPSLCARDGPDRLVLSNAGGSTTGVRFFGNRFTGWLTAWLNLLGLVTVLGAINVGTWGFFLRRHRALVPAISVDTRRRRVSATRSCSWRSSPAPRR